MKKWTVLILVLFSLLTLIACESDQTDVNTKTLEISDSADGMGDTDLTEKMVSTEPTINLYNVKITEANAFSDDYAWICYVNKNGAEVYGLANISGKIVYTLPEGLEVSKLWNYSDGFAAYRVGTDYKTSYEVVIDTAGKEYFRTEQTDQRQEHLLTWGNGLFLFTLNEASMTETIHSYIGKTSDGSVKYTLEDESASWNFNDNWRYVGEGWYTANHETYAINLSRGVNKKTGIGWLYGKFHDGEILCQIPMLGSRDTYIRFNSNLEQITDCDYTGDFQLYAIAERDYVEDGYYVYNSNYNNEGYGIPSVRRWNGNVIFEITKYPDVETKLYQFFGNFAPYEIEGMDKHTYLTAVNWQGKEMFEPRDLTAHGEKIVKKRLYNDHFLMQNSDGDYALMNLKQEYVHNVSKDFPECKIEKFLSCTQDQLIIEFKADKETYYKYYSIKDAIAAGSNRYAASVSEQQGTTTPETPSENNTPGVSIGYAGASVKFRESLFEKSAYVYDNELATLGAMLCMAAGRGEQEICQLFYQLGIEDANIENFNYGGENAFSIAHLPIRLNGEEMNLIFIVVRGSVVKREFIGDHFAKANREFLGYMAYDYVEDFEKKVWEAVKAYANAHEDLYDKSRAFFITGHSLGGATANLITALANNPETGNSWIFMDTDVSRVFTYTYGAIDSIKVDAPVTTGYQNIHNIYNFFDTYGPNGRDTLSAAGNSMYGKFGHIDKFAYRFSWENDLATSKNHIIDNYLRAIVEGAVSCESPYSYWEGDCPIDVEVLKDGAVVGRIVDNQVDEELLAAHPEVALMVVEDSKRVGVFDNPEAYSLRITATDDGEMSVSTVSFDDTGESYGAAEYPDVEIKTGQVFSMELPASDSGGSDPQTPELLLMNGDRISGKVNTDGSISPINGTGNGLQLALLAAIVIVSGFVVFWGGRRLKETEKLKFPIASIFTMILALGLLENFRHLLFRSGMLDQKIGYRMVVEFDRTFSVPHILYQVLLIGSMVLLAVLLFIRKRNGILAGALAVQTLLPAFTLVSFLLNCGSRGFFDVYEYKLHFGPMMWAIGICGCYMLEILCYLLLTFMAVTPCAKDGVNKGRLHRLWFLPGILGIFIAFAHFVGNIYFKRSDLSFFSDLFLIPMAFLLGWWLTHPYKKEKPVYQMPIVQPYGQPIYQATDTAQKVICVNCGRELLPDEVFCAGCGTRRPEPSQAEPGDAEQKVFCSGCGRELPPDEDFCCVCGAHRPNPLQDESIDL